METVQTHAPSDQGLHCLLKEGWASPLVKKSKISFFLFQAAIRGYFGRCNFQRRLYEHKTTIIQSSVRTYLARQRFKKVLYGIVKIQGHFKRRKAKAELKQLKVSYTIYVLKVGTPKIIM